MSTESLPIAERRAFSYRDAADYAGCSVTTIRRAVDGGHLIRSVPPGQSKPVVFREELDSWLDEGRNQ